MRVRLILLSLNSYISSLLIFRKNSSLSQRVIHIIVLIVYINIIYSNSVINVVISRCFLLI